MNPIADEMLELQHYGMPRRSGRYPWGSGDDPYQHTRDFLSRVEDMKKNGFTYTDENGVTWTGDKAIYKSMGLTSGQYRSEISIAKDQRLVTNIARAQSLKADGKGATEIGRVMGVPESTVRGWLEPNADASYRETKKTVDFLREQADKYGMVDVGVGVDLELNVSSTRLNTALHYLKEHEGYEVYSGRMDQINSATNKTTQKVLCVPGTEHKEIYDLERVHSLNEYISRDGGETYEKKFHYPESMSSDRLMIRYKNDVGPDGATGDDKDGIVELRRGVKDLSLGESHYSQVRILVDGDRYIKGMAVYSDNMPDGVDVVFNTNKSSDVPKRDVLKKIHADPDNPFGSLIKDADQGGQYWYDDGNGNKKLGLINKRADEGDWTDWKDALPSQFLSKQTEKLAKQQLDIAKSSKQLEFEEIRELNNPTIKKHLLQKFADECDSAAVHLQAAALPGQKYHVIIPVNSLKDNEVYAPQYKDGTKLALVRYPHGGTFEIPVLTVNNKHENARNLIGTNSIDAVGINKKIADRLSGADFDGDTVMCIPTDNGKVKISRTNELPGLKGFDPKMEYGPETYKGRNIKYMTKTDTEMGKISNLITDMTLAGASPEKLARAVRHSMVVIDAEKHKLDYKKSEVDNGIAALKKEFQPKYDSDGNPTGRYGGASTIISRSKGETTVNKRQGSAKINDPRKADYDPSKPAGALIWKDADDLYYPVRKYNKDTGDMTVTTSKGKKITYNMSDKDAVERYNPVKKVDADGNVTYTNKDGDITYKLGKRTQKSTRMAETDDANTLVSEARHPMEKIYADYANSMKALANQARQEFLGTGKIAYNASAKATYQTEVDSLETKLRNAQVNAVKERAATRKANVELASKKASYKAETGEDMKTKDAKKIGQQAINRAREQVGAVKRKDRNIQITDREWEAIQAGAISETQLKKILNNTDIGSLRERATPRTNGTSLTKAKVNQIQSMSASYTIGQIADKLGISPSTVSKYLKGGTD
jgi:hypothetical protein